MYSPKHELIDEFLKPDILFGSKTESEHIKRFGTNGNYARSKLNQ